MTLVLLLSGSLAACGALSGNDGTTDSGSADQPREGAPPPEDQVVPVGQSFWHSGFQVEVIDATLAGGSLALGASFTNLGESQSYFGAEVAVVAGGTSYPIGFDSEVPDVPSGLTSEGTLIFPVEEGFDLATAQLVVGSAEENQAQVPLGPQGSELVDLAPREVPLTGELSLELLDLTFTSAEVRADVVNSYSEMERGSLALTLSFTATARTSGALYSSEFALILPDGAAVGLDDYHLPALSGNESGVDTEGLWVRFIVHDPPEGDYAMRYTSTSSWQGEEGDAESMYEFSL